PPNASYAPIPSRNGPCRPTRRGLYSRPPFPAWRLNHVLFQASLAFRLGRLACPRVASRLWVDLVPTDRLGPDPGRGVGRRISIRERPRTGSYAGAEEKSFGQPSRKVAFARRLDQ